MTSGRTDHEQQPVTQQSVASKARVGDRPPGDPRQLREEIKETREELGETVEALVQKTDVKGQLQGKVAERKETLRAAREQARQRMASVARQARERRTPLATAAALLVAGLVVLWLVRRD